MCIPLNVTLNFMIDIASAWKFVVRLRIFMLFDFFPGFIKFTVKVNLALGQRRFETRRLSVHLIQSVMFLKIIPDILIFHPILFFRQQRPFQLTLQTIQPSFQILIFFRKLDDLLIDIVLVFFRVSRIRCGYFLLAFKLFASCLHSMFSISGLLN